VLMILWPRVAQVPTSHERPAATASQASESFVPLGQITYLDSLGLIISHAVHDQLQVYAANLGEHEQAGGVLLDDGEGHQLEVIGSEETVPARSVQSRVIEVQEGFNKKSSRLTPVWDSTGDAGL